MRLIWSSTILIAVIFFAIMRTNARATTLAPLCEAGIVEEMPAHIKKICLALQNSNQLTSALQSYIKNEAVALVSDADDLIPSGYGKRTDVDHVFLRFGRKR